MEFSSVQFSLRRRRRKRCMVYRECGEDGEMIRWRAVGGRERWASEQSEEGDEQVENMMFVVGWKVDMLSNVEGGEKRQKLRREVVRRIIEVNVKVASDDEFMRGGSREREKKKKKEWVSE